MKLLALALTLGATFCWGSAQIIGKLALRKITTLFFNTVRFSVATAAIVLGGVLFGSVGSVEFGPPFLAAVASGVFGWFIATTVFFYVLKRGAAHRIIPAGNAYPFWAILLASSFIGERVTFVIPISAALVFLGTFLLARRRREEESRWRFGISLASLVAFLWGLNAVLNKFALNGGMTRSSLLLVRVVSAAILFWMAFGLTTIGRERSFHGRSIGLSVLSGMVAFPVGSLLYLSALSMEEASVLAPVTGATILFGFLLSIGILGESPTKKAVLGMLSIFGGILLMVL